jgi:glycosyltransferase involved in cell wall biosynthesis
MIFLANSEAEHRLMTARGLGSAWVSHNAFVDPATFRPLPGRAKRFDAVYDARVCPFKRHHLATGVESLSLVTARVGMYHDQAYVRSVRELLPHARWANDPLAADWRSLSWVEINEALNEARAGLCLSAVEGAMFASIQYLLAGLPVVSTASRGGRDEFFHPDYVRIVADDPAAVAAGVREIASCPVPAEEIRRRTLERIEPHKARLFELLDAICATEGRPAIPRSRWASWGAPQLTRMVAPAQLRRRIEEARGSGDHG